MNITEKFYKKFEVSRLCSSRICQKWGPECSKCCHYETSINEYPEITDRILLELMCIASEAYPYCINCRETVDELREFVLSVCIRHSKDIDKEKVRKLFEVN